MSKNGKGIFGLDKKGLCLPLIIYATLSVLGLVGLVFGNQTQGNRTQSFLVSLIWTLFWSYIMYDLCKNSHEGWAWVLLLLPLILWLILFVIVAVLGLVEPGPVKQSFDFEDDEDDE